MQEILAHPLMDARNLTQSHYRRQGPFNLFFTYAYACTDTYTYTFTYTYTYTHSISLSHTHTTLLHLRTPPLLARKIDEHAYTNGARHR